MAYVYMYLTTKKYDTEKDADGNDHSSIAGQLQRSRVTFYTWSSPHFYRVNLECLVPRRVPGILGIVKCIH